jgi:hypothetical protein
MNFKITAKVFLIEQPKPMKIINHDSLQQGSLFFFLETVVKAAHWLCRLVSVSSVVVFGKKSLSQYKIRLISVLFSEHEKSTWGSTSHKMLIF